MTNIDNGGEVVGLWSDEEIHEVIEGDKNRFELWKQEKVILELHCVLEARLSTLPVLQDALRSSKNEPVFLSKKSMFRKFVSAARADDLGGSLTVRHATLGERAVHVKVTLEDVCMRTVSDFGLYETLSRPVIVVRCHAK